MLTYGAFVKMQICTKPARVPTMEGGKNTRIEFTSSGKWDGPSDA